ncbi:MAG: hypothetical protein JXQ96_09715 [Cyclobacteriaceae bacterium]
MYFRTKLRVVYWRSSAALRQVRIDAETPVRLLAGVQHDRSWSVASPYTHSVTLNSFQGLLRRKIVLRYVRIDAETPVRLLAEVQHDCKMLFLSSPIHPSKEEV